MSDPVFPCTGCGGCCRLVGRILSSSSEHLNPVFKFAIETFPYTVDEYGACEKLVNNQCSVYAERPLMCNVSLMGEMLGEDTSAWYSKNIKYCNLIIDILGIDPLYKIPNPDLQ